MKCEIDATTGRVVFEPSTTEERIVLRAMVRSIVKGGEIFALPSDQEPCGMKIDPAGVKQFGCAETMEKFLDSVDELPCTS